MLNAESSAGDHVRQNVKLLVLSSIALPFTTALFLISYVLKLFLTHSSDISRRHVVSTYTPYFERRTVLITGVGMTKGLTLARLCYAAGHHVIGADFESPYFPTSCGHVSKSIKAFYKLYKPDGSIDGSARYGESLLNIIKKEKVDLWISCSGVASAVEDGRAKEMIEAITDCRAVQYGASMTSTLHEKHLFMNFTREIGLPVPETHNITSHATALKLLDKAQDRGIKFIMKYTGTDDAFRANMTLLPLATNEATEKYISRFPISQSRPWILQQFISGPEYCTHALVVRNTVVAFVACPSAELLMHYVALPSDSVLSQAMLRFTQRFVEKCPEDFTGHLSFDFLVDQTQADQAVRGSIGVSDVTLYPIECNPRAHTAVVLFSDTPEMISEGYMKIFDAPPSPIADAKSHSHKLNGSKTPAPIYPRNPQKYYWIQHDLVDLIILPMLNVFRKDGPSFAEVLDKWSTFLEHLTSWRDGTYQIWDPAPALWLWQVSWPWIFIRSIINEDKWSRVNVSTMKVFGC